MLRVSRNYMKLLAALAAVSVRLAFPTQVLAVHTDGTLSTDQRDTEHCARQHFCNKSL